MSPSQIAAAKQLEAAATNASSLATPQLLDYLNSNLSRTALAKDCPSIANDSASVLLDRILAELRVSELVEAVGTGQYQRLTQLMETRSIHLFFCYCLWTIICLFSCDILLRLTHIKHSPAFSTIFGK